MKSQMSTFGLSKRGLKILIPLVLVLILFYWIAPTEILEPFAIPLFFGLFALGTGLVIAFAAYIYKNIFERKDSYYRDI